MKQFHYQSQLISCLAMLGMQAHAQTSTPLAVNALPSGGKVVSGQVSIQNTSPNTMTIGQGSNRAVIDWNSFNIGSQASVQFNQPNAQAVVLNRVLDTNPSQIMGRLSANGQVFISNPQGVVFGPTAQVDVAGLIATTQNISANDFNAAGSSLSLTGGTGSVVNQGKLTAALGGYIALLAPEVRNEGVILAREGTVALAAGQKTILQFADSRLVSVLIDEAVLNALVVNQQVIRAEGGLVILSARSANAILGSVIQQSGTVEALSLVNREGRVFLDGGDKGQVAMTGQISAAGAQANSQGGQVVVTGDQVTIGAQAKVDASGPSGGGRVLIGGDWQGQNPLIRQANEVLVQPGAILNASATGKGNGGTVVVWSNTRNPQGKTQVQGQLLARGGAQGGDGGRIETSGHALNTDGVKGDASAPAGKAGTWLFDPWNVEITSATANNSASGGTWTPSATGSTILNTAINTLLDAGTSVVVSTTGIGAEDGNITVSSPITRSATTGAVSLTMNADKNITVNSPISISGSGSMLALNAGTAGTVALGGKVTVDTLSVTIPGAGTLSQTTEIDVNNLKLVGATSNMSLDHLSNRIGTVAANVNDLTLRSNTGANLSDPYGTGLYVGTISGLSGVSAAGLVNIRVGNGNLFLTQNISTSSTSASAMLLNAGADLSPGAYTGALSGVNPYGFNIILTSGKTISVGSGGTAKLYTGSVAGSGQTLSTYVGSGSGRFRYNSNESSQAWNTALSTGLNVIYREDPLLTVTSSSRAITYGGSFSALTPSVSTTKNGDLISSTLPSLTETMAGNVTSTQGYTQAGSYTISPSYSLINALGYRTTNVTGTLTVNPKALTVSALTTLANNKIYDGTTAATLQLSTNKYDLDLVTAVPSTTVFASKIVGNSKVITASGLSLTGADAANYSLSSTSVTATGNITARTLTLSYAGQDKVYDGTTAASVTVTDDRVAGDVLTIGKTAVFANKNVDNNKVVTVSGAAISGTDASNYTLTSTTASTTASITPRTLNLSYAGQNKVYDGSTSASVTVTDDRVAGDVLTIGQTAVFADKNAANGKVVTVSGATISSTDSGNYTLASNSGSTTANITPKALTATISANSKQYDQTTAATSTITSISGYVGSEDLNVSGTATFNNKNVGDSKTVTLSAVSLSDGSNGGLASNYTLATGATTTANITAKPLAVIAVANDKVYDGTATATYVLTSDQFLNDLLTITGTTGLFSDKNAGTGKTVTVGGIEVTGTDAGNYTLLNPTTTTTASIAKKTLTATLTAPNKVYDGTTTATPTLTIASGLVGAETVTATGTATFNTKDVSTANLVTVATTSLTDGSNGGLASNYTLPSGQSITANITPKALTATASDPGKTYDGTTTAAPVLTITAGLLGSDDVTATGTGTFNSKNVATANVVTVNTTVLANGLTDGLATNYSLASGITTTSSITARPVTVTAPTVTKTYDGTTAVPSSASVTPALPVVTTGSLAAQDSITDSGLAFASARSGTGKTVTASNLVIKDNSGRGDVMNSNYNISYADNTVSVIERKTLTPTLSNTNVIKPYDGTTDAPSGFTPTFTWSGLVSGDTDATLTNSGMAYNSKNVSTATQVTVSGLQLSGITGSVGVGSTTTDYVLDSPVKSVTARINPVTLSATVTAPDKAYDGTTVATPTISINSAGFVGSETVSASGTASFSSKNVIGTQTVTVNTTTLFNGDHGGLAENYSLGIGQTTSASITPKTLTASATAPNKTYDGTNTASPTLLINSAGLVGTETVTATGTATFNSAHVDATQVTVNSVTLANGSNGGLASNYDLSPGQTVASLITPKTLTPAIANGPLTKDYDGSTAAPTGFTPSYTWSGLVTGDTDATMSHSSAIYNSKNVSTANMVTVNGLQLTSITSPTLNSSINDYALDASSKSVIARITPLTLTAAAAPVTKTYDGNTSATPVLTITSGLLGTETVTPTGTASFNSKNVTGATTITVDQVNLVNGSNGGLAENYTLAAGQTAIGTITRKALTATATDHGKTYDGNANAAPTLTITSGLVGSERVTATATGQFNSAHAATANLVTVDSVSLADGSNGGLADNYSLTAGQTVGSTISRKTLSPTISNTNVIKAYDGTTAAPNDFTPTYNWNGAGLISGDTSASINDTSRTYNSQHVVGANTVTVSGLSLSGINGGNGSLASDYQLDNTSKTVAASIIAKTITPTITNSGVSKVYDGTTAAPTGFTPSFSWSGLVTGDSSATLSYTSSAYNSANVLSASQITVNGLQLTGPITGNKSSAITDYVLDANSKTVAASITPKLLQTNVINSGVTKFYDGTTAAPAGFTPQFSAAGMIAGDSVSLGSTGAAYNSKNVAGATQLTINGVNVASVSSTVSLPSDYRVDATSKSIVANIKPRPITLVAPAVSKTYDGNASVVSDRSQPQNLPQVTSGSLANGDLISSSRMAYDSPQAGMNKTVTLDSALIVDSNRADMSSNYATTFTGNRTSEIKPLAVAPNIAEFFGSEDTLASSAPQIQPMMAMTAPITPVNLAAVDAGKVILPPVAALSKPPEANTTGNLPAKLTPDQQALQGFTPKALGQWSEVQVKSLPASQVAVLDGPQLRQVMRSLDADVQIQAINPLVMPKIDLQTLAGLTNRQIMALTPEQLSNMTRAQINFILPILTPEQIQSIQGKPGIKTSSR